MRRLFLIFVTLSTLTAAAAGGLWYRSHTIWESAYVRTGSWLWNVDSAEGAITLHWYGGWPSPPTFLHTVANHDPTKGVGPVFAVQYAGAGRSKWQCGPASGEHGTTRVVIDPVGNVDWNAPAMPILQSFATARFSPLFRFWSVSLPLWAIALLLLLPIFTYGLFHPATFLIRRCRRVPGLCPGCGYDIRASPARCPECGRVVTAPTSTPHSSA